MYLSFAPYIKLNTWVKLQVLRFFTRKSPTWLNYIYKSLIPSDKVWKFSLCAFFSLVGNLTLSLRINFFTPPKHKFQSSVWTLKLKKKKLKITLPVSLSLISHRVWFSSLILKLSLLTLNPKHCHLPIPTQFSLQIPVSIDSSLFCHCLLLTYSILAPNKGWFLGEYSLFLILPFVHLSYIEINH